MQKHKYYMEILNKEIKNLFSKCSNINDIDQCSHKIYDIVKQAKKKTLKNNLFSIFDCKIFKNIKHITDKLFDSSKIETKDSSTLIISNEYFHLKLIIDSPNYYISIDDNDHIRYSFFTEVIILNLDFSSDSELYEVCLDDDDKRYKKGFSNRQINEIFNFILYNGSESKYGGDFDGFDKCCCEKEKKNTIYNKTISKLKDKGINLTMDELQIILYTLLSSMKKYF